MEKTIQLCALYIATLKAIVLISQNNHWISKGGDFYEMHLLYERIYNAANESLDLCAEKFVGLFSDEVLDYSLQIEVLNLVLENYENEIEDPVNMLLSITLDFLKLNQEFSDHVEKTNEMSLGLSDMLGGIASTHETTVYFLKQIQSK